jgi:hypothetical protein
MELAVHVFNYDALTRGVIHDIVKRWHYAPLFERYRCDLDAANVLFHLFDGRVIFQYPRTQLPWRDGSGRLGSMVFHVAGGGGEVEQANRQTLLIDPFEHYRQANAIGPD